MGCGCQQKTTRKTAAARAARSGPSFPPPGDGVMFEVRCADHDTQTFTQAADAARVAAELGCGPPVAVGG